MGPPATRGVPSVTNELPQSGIARAWDARALIDPFAHRSPTTFVQPAFCCLSSQRCVTLRPRLRSLTTRGLDGTMAARLVAPMTPLLRERAQKAPGGLTRMPGSPKTTGAQPGQAQ